MGGRFDSNGILPIQSMTVMYTANRLGLALGLSLMILAGCDSANLTETELDTSDLSDPSLTSFEADESLDLASADKYGHGRHVRAGMVFTMSDAADGNQVLAYGRAANGRITSSHAFETGGLGSGDGLNGTTHPLILSPDSRYLYAVNAGSNTVSIFRRIGRNLRLLGTVPSGGTRPSSITTHGNLVYVVNVGGSEPANITGFRMYGGHLRQVVTRPVSAGAADLPQIDFSPDGRYLVVTDKATNTITTYVVDRRGIAGDPSTFASAGQTPFGFDIRWDNTLFVSEAVGGATDASSASTYKIRRDGSLEVISAAVPTTETAACWADLTANGRFGYVTNGGSGTLSGYRMDRRGNIELLNADGETVSTGDGSTPLDLDIVGNSLLYVHTKGTNGIQGFRIDQRDGSLTPISGGDISGLPSTTVGVIAF